WTEQLRGDAEPADRRRTIVARPKLDPASLRPAAAAMTEVRRLGAELAIDAAHGLRLRLTGAAALDTEELQSVMQSASRSAIGSLVLVAVLVFIGLRSPRLIASVMVTLIAGLIWTAAFAAAAIGQLNLISVTFTVLFIGLGIDFGIHFGLRYREAVDDGVDQAAALRRAAVGVGPSLTISAVAAALAFYSFFPTAYRGLSELGLIAGTGMFIALFANLTLLPALLSVMPLRRSARPLPPILGPAVERFIDARRRPICVAALALGLAALPLLVELRFDFNPINLKDPNTESMQALRDLTQAGGAARATISVLAADIEAAAAQAARLEQLDRVDKTVALSDFVPRDQDAKLAVIDQTAFFLGPLLLDAAVKPPPDDGERRAAVDSFRGKLAALLASGHAGPAAAAMRRLSAALDGLSAAGGDMLRGLEADLVGTLPGRIESLRRAFNAGPVTFADLPDDLRRRYLAPDGRARIEVYPAEDIDDIEAQRRFVAAVRSLAPDAAGSPVVLLEAGNAVVRAFQQASTAALVLITVLMLLLLRSLWDVALVLVPVALSAALTMATSVLVGLPFNFANIIVLPLLLGLGVASGVQLVMRVRQPGARLLDTSTPRAVLFSALTTVGSLGTLALSSHRGIAGMGLLLTVAIAFTLLGALIVLPAMLALRARPGKAGPQP
ncbi:MAG TPA: MMPL family transporter, partial [Dongiaceae bacterium]|nr:MMPL family transporter [Dongiaceae bacterium]